VAAELWSIENNLSGANMDFEEFAHAVDDDGVFRGFESLAALSPRGGCGSGSRHGVAAVKVDDALGAAVGRRQAVGLPCFVQQEPGDPLQVVVRWKVMPLRASRHHNASRPIWIT
jgi:hypothetical protein